MTAVAQPCLSFDVVVIGSGPAGQKAAMHAATAGKRVAIIERDRHAGGACVHAGAIAGRSLRDHALRQRERQAGIETARLQSLRDDMGSAAAARDAYLAAHLERHHIVLLRGRAQFTSTRELSLEHIDGSRMAVRAPVMIIATGSRPHSPAHLAVDHEHVLDSDSILSLAYLPRSLLVIGGGTIACEYAALFAALGCWVTQADELDQPLAFLDPELARFYLDALADHGGEFLPHARASTTRWDGVSQVRVDFADGRSVTADKVLVALSRRANVLGMNLDAAGIALTPSGHIHVDENLMTTAPGVYAAGDVIGPPTLAAVSMEQGRRAAAHALGMLLPSEPVSRQPSGVYTIPEIATVGLDEHGARRHFGGALVGRARFRDLVHGPARDSTRGLLKLIADPGGRRVVGVQIAGEGATELIHIGQLGLAAGLEVDAYVENTFNFPSMAEAYRVAAQDIVTQRGRTTTSDLAADAAASVL